MVNFTAVNEATHHENLCAYSMQLSMQHPVHNACIRFRALSEMSNRKSAERCFLTKKKGRTVKRAPFQKHLSQNSTLHRVPKPFDRLKEARAFRVVVFGKLNELLKQFFLL